MARYALVAAIISLVATFVCIAIFKKMSVPVVIASSMLSGLVLLYWFVSAEKRSPEKRELKQIYLVYGLLLACGWFAMPLITGRYTVPGLITLCIYVLAYPAFLAFIFRRKTIDDLLLKKNA